MRRHSALRRFSYRISTVGMHREFLDWLIFSMLRTRLRSTLGQGRTDDGTTATLGSVAAKILLEKGVERLSVEAVGPARRQIAQYFSFHVPRDNTSAVQAFVMAAHAVAP